jgi:putative hydrolase of the HAD superfamily
MKERLPGRYSVACGGAKVEALLLDLDGTLLDDRAAVRTAFAAFLAAHPCGRPVAEAHARWRVLAAKHWSRFERGEISFAEQRRFRVREFLERDMSDAQADAAFEPYRVAYEAGWRLYPECMRFLQLTQHLPKVVVTNGDRAQQLLKIERLGLSDRLVAAVTPQDCGAWKPHHPMFLAALGHVGVPADRCMMIGDDAERDIRPARELGLLTHHVDRNDSASSLLDALGPPAPT